MTNIKISPALEEFVHDLRVLLNTSASIMVDGDFWADSLNQLLVNDRERVTIHTRALLAKAKEDGAREFAEKILGSNAVIDMDYVVERKDIGSPLFWAEVNRIRTLAKELLKGASNSSQG